MPDLRGRLAQAAALVLAASGIGVGAAAHADAAPASAPDPVTSATPQAQDARWEPSLASTIAQMPKNLPRAQAPDLGASIKAALSAVKACRAQGAKVSVLVADVLGKPVVLLSGEGAGVRSQLIAQTKANIVARYHQPSSEVAERAKSDPALTAQAAADPGIGMLRGGGLPLVRNGTQIGIVAVSGGGLGGDLLLDEKCARVAAKELLSS